MLGQSRQIVESLAQPPPQEASLGHVYNSECRLGGEACQKSSAGGILRTDRGAPTDGELVRVSRSGKDRAGASRQPRRAGRAHRAGGEGNRATEPPRRFEVKRRNDNELILFVADLRESWIVYPPRSQYEFLDRPTSLRVLVEHHPWEPYTPVVMHQVDATKGCHEHGLACGANAAIQAGIGLAGTRSPDRIGQIIPTGLPLVSFRRERVRVIPGAPRRGDPGLNLYTPPARTRYAGGRASSGTRKVEDV